MRTVNQLFKVVAQVGCALALAAVCSSAAIANDPPFPSRPLKLIVPYAPGGGTDQIARPFAEHLSRRLGQQVAVENRPGAASNIGGQALATSEPNGYTMMIGSNQLIINAIFGPKPPFDPVQGFATVGLITEVPYVLAVKADSPVHRARDLLTAKANRELTISHAQFEPQLKLISQAMGVPVLGIPYQGGAQAITAVLSGEVPAVFAGISAVSAMVKDGRLRLVGITSSRRISSFPDVPTFVEQGFPDLVTTGWLSLLVPKGTPAPVLQRLGDATLATVRDPAFVDRVRAAGAEPLEVGASEAGLRMAAEHALWTKVAR